MKPKPCYLSNEHVRFSKQNSKMELDSKILIVFQSVLKQPYVHQMEFLGFRYLCELICTKIEWPFMVYQCSRCYKADWQNSDLSFSTTFNLKILKNLHLVSSKLCICFAEGIRGIYRQLAFKAFYKWPLQHYLELKDTLFQVGVLFFFTPI